MKNNPAKNKKPFNITKTAVQKFDQHGNIIYWDIESKKLFGYTKKEAEGKKFSSLMLPANKRKIFQQKLTGLPRAKKSYFAEEISLKTKGKTFIDVLCTVSLVKSSGNVPELCCTFTDISERLKSDRKLSEATHSLGERIKELTCLYNISSLSNSTNEIDELLSKTIRYLPPAFQFTENLEACISFNKKSYKTSRFRKSKHCINVRRKLNQNNILEITTVYSGGNKNDSNLRFIKEEVKLINTIADNLAVCINRITTEQKFHKNREHLKAIVNSEPECVKVISKDGTLLEMNPAGLKMLEVENPKIVMGKTILKLIHPDDRDKFIKLHRSTLKGNSGEAKFRIIGLKGTVRIMESNSVPLRDTKGNVTSVLSVTRDITEQETALQKLYESNERYVYVTRATFDAIWDWNLENDEVYWGDGFESLFGYKIKNNTGDISSWYDHIHPDDRQNVLESIYDVINDRSRVSWRREYRYKKCNGEYAYVIDRGIVLRNNKGKAYRMVGAMQDITAIKTAKLKAEKRKIDLQNILDRSPDIICTIDTEGNFLKVSAACETILGYKPEEIRNKSFREFTHPDDIENTENASREALSGAKLSIFENRMSGKNGKYVPLVWSAKWNEKDKVFYAIARDATEKKLAEEELKLSEEKYRTLFNASPIPKWVFDVQSMKFLDINDAACKHYGYSREEFLSMSVYDIRPKEDLQKFHDSVRQLSGADTVKPHGIFRHIKKSGEIIHVEITTVKIQYKQMDAFMVLALDVTERLKYIEAIEKQNAKLKEIAWMQSHVVRAPLTKLMGIVNSIDLINENGMSGKQTAELILNSAKELDRIIRDISKKTESIE